MLFHVTMIRSEDNCPAYHTWWMPEALGDVIPYYPADWAMRYVSAKILTTSDGCQTAFHQAILRSGERTRCEVFLIF